MCFKIFSSSLLNIYIYSVNIYIFIYIYTRLVYQVGEGNGTPLQCSCLENPKDGGVWWAAIYGVAQSRTRLKRLSNSNNNRVRLGASQLALVVKNPPTIQETWV